MQLTVCSWPLVTRSTWASRCCRQVVNSIFSTWHMHTHQGSHGLQSFSCGTSCIARRTCQWSPTSFHDETYTVKTAFGPMASVGLLLSRNSLGRGTLPFMITRRTILRSVAILIWSLRRVNRRFWRKVLKKLKVSNVDLECLVNTNLQSLSLKSKSYVCFGGLAMLVNMCPSVHCLKFHLMF